MMPRAFYFPWHVGNWALHERMSVHIQSNENILMHEALYLIFQRN